MTRAKVVPLGLCMALLVASGCGARWSDEERAAVHARGRGGGSSAADRADTGSGSGSGAVTVGGLDRATAGSSGTGSGTGNGSPAAGGGTARQGQGGPLPCAAPSDAPGVTDATITVGSISTLSGPVPGLGRSSQAAAQAYVAYLNANGGVCGREIVLRTADDGYETARNRAVMVEFESTTLGIVGGLATGDGGSVDVVRQSGIPVVSLPTAKGFELLPTVFDTNPPYADNRRPTAKTRFLYAQGVRTAAYVYADIAQARDQIAEHRAQAEATGIEVVLDLPMPIATLSYASAARAIANSKADYLFFLHDAGADAAMARELDTAGYRLKFEEYLTAYGSKFIEVGGAAVEGATSWIRTLPDEDGGRVPEQARFVEWMDRTAPSEVTDTFASDSWVGTKAFFDSLQALPGPITREALVAQLRSVDTYDADGFLGTIQLGRKLNNGCIIAMIVRNGKWARLTPASGFLC